MKTQLLFTCILTVCLVETSGGQELEDILNEQMEETQDVFYETGTFKGARVINGHSVETMSERELLFLIGHRFGQINSGFYNLFGLDQAAMRLGLAYGITDNLNVGIARSNFQKTFDGFLKYKFLRQSEGKRKFPLTITALGGYSVNTVKNVFPDEKNDFTGRSTFFSQILMARKFNHHISLQVAPVWIHSGYQLRFDSDANLLALGIAGRVKLTKRIHMTGEYYYQVNEESLNLIPPLSVGFDIETGGHIFQLMFSNSQSMFEKAFLFDTVNKWQDGGIFFGFNINRVFYFK